MFWECHLVASSIDKLLDQPSDTLKLKDFLDENDLIQECLTQNTRLMDYLIQPDIMHELIGYIIQCPKDGNFRYAHVVSELLSGDFQRLQETLLDGDHLDLLYSFLISTEDENPTEILNPILASYFSRILMTLMIRRPIELLNYLKSRKTFKEDFLRHLNSISITDVLYRLIADCAEQRVEAIKWYEEINLIDGLFQHLFITESIDVQMNIVNLLSDFLRLAFDQHNAKDNDIQRDTSTPVSSSTMNYLYQNRNENNEESSSDNDIENKSRQSDVNGHLTPLTLAQHILSKRNLEHLFDTMSRRPTLVSNGCDFLITFLDLLARSMPSPICISLTSFVSNEKLSSKDQSTSSGDKEDNEQMQINNEDDTLPTMTSNETNRNICKNLNLNVQDPLIGIYLTLLDVIPCRLPPLIGLLSNPSAPLIPLSSSSPSHDSSQTVKYQFISEPLGSMRLNLIKFFCKLIYTISNDYTGDSIYQILNTNRLLYILIDLFHHHIYNNFLHTQVYLFIRLIFHVNSMAVRQPNDIWTRTPLLNHFPSSQTEFLDSSLLYYLNRCSYKLFQSLLTSSEVNLIERLLDQYELNVASSKSITTSSSSDDAITSALLHTRFASPNSGHSAQILRCLREHSFTFHNYSTYLKTDEHQLIDDNTSVLEIRWQTALDYLSDDEKKWLAMHHNDRNYSNNFCMNSSTNLMVHINNVINSHDSHEANQRRQTFQMKALPGNGAPYMDDVDEEDDEVGQFGMDDELMNNERMTGERKMDAMKKISFASQFSHVFDEQSLWQQQDDTDTTIDSNINTDDDTMKKTSMDPLPDLFESHRIQQEKSASTESSFENLCSLRTNDHGNGPVLFQFKSTRSSVNHDEIDDGQEEF